LISKIIHNIISVLLSSFLLFGASLIIWLFMKGSGTSLKDVLFCIGAAPIVIFAAGQIGNFKSRGDHTVQLSRSAGNQSLHERAAQDMQDIKSYFKSGLSWFLAGLVIMVGLFLT
jgi:hypothetical protein